MGVNAYSGGQHADSLTGMRVCYVRYGTLKLTDLESGKSEDASPLLVAIFTLCLLISTECVEAASREPDLMRGQRGGSCGRHSRLRGKPWGRGKKIPLAFFCARKEERISECG